LKKLRIHPRNGRADMHPSRITDAFDAQLRELVDLHAAKGFKEFWRSARPLLHAVLPGATVWFAPAPDWVSPSAAFWEETAFKTEAQFQRFQERHPLKAFLLANPQKRLATLSDVMTDAQLLRSRFYREFMASRDERFSAVLAFWHRNSLRALIGLNRVQNDRDFSSAELRTLRSLHWHFGEALNRVRNLQRERSARDVLELVLAPLPLPVVALDWELDVLYHNRAANESAVLWMRGQEAVRCLKPASRFEMPADVAALCRERKAAWSRSSERGGNSSGRSNVAIAHRTLPGFQALVRVVHLNPPEPGMPLFVVVFENTRGTLPQLASAGTREFSQLSRLSVCEREVAALACKGESNKEIAAHLGKSVLTVKTQLQSIYGKLGKAGRGKLSALLFEG
jgi:DNA-binding CsgD family transcriptional regulator